MLRTAFTIWGCSEKYGAFGVEGCLSKSHILTHWGGGGGEGVLLDAPSRAGEANVENNIGENK